MPKMTKSSCRKRLREAVSKANKCLDSDYFTYEMSAVDYRKLMSARDDLVKLVKKLK
jgi:hypothetical protein